MTPNDIIFAVLGLHICIMTSCFIYFVCTVIIEIWNIYQQQRLSNTTPAVILVRLPTRIKVRNSSCNYYKKYNQAHKREC